METRYIDSEAYPLNTIAPWFGPWKDNSEMIRSRLLPNCNESCAITYEHSYLMRVGFFRCQLHGEVFRTDEDAVRVKGAVDGWAIGWKDVKDWPILQRATFGRTEEMQSGPYVEMETQGSSVPLQWYLAENCRIDDENVVRNDDAPTAANPPVPKGSIRITAELDLTNTEARAKTVEQIHRLVDMAAGVADKLY